MFIQVFVYLFNVKFNVEPIRTFRRTLVLVVPDHQQLGQTGHFGDLGDDPEETLDPVVGQNHGGESRGARRNQREEKRTVHAGPLLLKRDREEKTKKQNTNAE